MNRVKNKVAIVTGGSLGIGRAAKRERGKKCLAKCSL